MSHSPNILGPYAYGFVNYYSLKTFCISGHNFFKNSQLGHCLLRFGHKLGENLATPIYMLFCKALQFYWKVSYTLQFFFVKLLKVKN